MKKYFIIIVTIPIILYGMFFAFFTWSVEYYNRRTYEDVFKNKKLLEHYSIGKKRTPTDYGVRYENTVFTSGDQENRIRLHAWFIPSEKKSKKAIIMVHGRTANRMKPMKYIDLFKNTGILKNYNLFLPDLRNSGMSPEARTMLGKYFAQDLFGAVQFLHKNYSIDSIVLYSFSMGSMASMIFLNDENYLKFMSENNIKIEKLIMDSPMSNAKENLVYGSVESGYPEWLTRGVLSGYSLWFDGNLDHLRLSYLLPKIHIPVLILQGKMDKTTPYDIFKKELSSIDQKKHHFRLIYFDHANHVFLYPHKEYHQTYIKTISNFFANP